MVLRLIKPFVFYLLICRNWQPEVAEKVVAKPDRHCQQVHIGLNHFLKLLQSRKAAQFSQEKTKVNNLSTGSFQLLVMKNTEKCGCIRKHQLEAPEHCKQDRSEKYFFLIKVFVHIFEPKNRYSYVNGNEKCAQCSENFHVLLPRQGSPTA